MKVKIISIINILLIVISITFSIYFVLTKDSNIGSILKDLSIIITITIPYIAEKVFKIKIADWIKFIFILFIFMAHFLGATCEIYDKISFFDKITHTLSGIVTAFFSLLILKKMKKYNKKTIAFNILFIMAMTMMVASVWEIFEYFANIFFGGDAQRVELTGVNDTMQDMIVALIGGFITSIVYYIKEKNNHSIIDKIEI